MKKALLAVLLIIAALLLGLGLPEAAAALQAKNAEQTEDAGIRPVDLHIGSDLSHTEKLALLSTEECTVLNVGVARYQTPASLSQHSWKLLETVMSGYGAPLLDSSSTQQVEQFALMASAGDRSFLFWEVMFMDGNGSILLLHLDDETGLPLAMSYTCADPGAPVDEWCALSLYGMGELCGLSLGGSMDEISVDTLPEVPHYYIPVTDGKTTATVKVQVGPDWFLIGDQIG